MHDGPKALTAPDRMRLLGDPSALSTLASRVQDPSSHPDWRQDAGNVASPAPALPLPGRVEPRFGTAPAST